MHGYTLQCSNEWWESGETNNTTEKWIERMTHSGDIYVNIQSFIETVNEFIKAHFEDYYLENYEEYTEEERNLKINQECKKYAINEDILNNIKIGDYYLLFHDEHDEVNWVIRCHNIISAHPFRSRRSILL